MRWDGQWKEVEFSEWIPKHKVGYVGSLFCSRGRASAHWESLSGAAAGAWELSPEGSPGGSRKRLPWRQGRTPGFRLTGSWGSKQGGGEMEEGTTGKSNTFQTGFLLRPLQVRAGRISSLPNHSTPSQTESSAHTSLPPEVGGVRRGNQGLKG